MRAGATSACVVRGRTRRWGGAPRCACLASPAAACSCPTPALPRPRPFPLQRGVGRRAPDPDPVSCLPPAHRHQAHRARPWLRPPPPATRAHPPPSRRALRYLSCPQWSLAMHASWPGLERGGGLCLHTTPRAPVCCASTPSQFGRISLNPLPHISSRTHPRAPCCTAPPTL